MNGDPSKASLNLMLSLILRIGLFLAIITVFYGAILLLWKHGNDRVDYHIFDSQPTDLKIPYNIFIEALTGDALAIIQLGIMILIATPIVRVVSCLVLFAAERDLLYVILSAVVLGILLYANL